MRKLLKRCILLLLLLYGISMWPATVDVPYKSQLPMLPNGCEVVSLEMALREQGVAMDAMSFAQTYLRRSDIYTGHPNRAYVGEPWGSGFYCYAKPLAKSANAYLKDVGSEKKAYARRFKPFFLLSLDLHRGKAPVVWVTRDDQSPRKMPSESWLDDHGKGYTPYENLHVVVLSGVRGPFVRLEDPIQGTRWMPIWRFLYLYDRMGMRSLIIR